MFFGIHFQNVDVDDVETSSNIYVKIANNVLWSIITPYLDADDRQKTYYYDVLKHSLEQSLGAIH